LAGHIAENKATLLRSGEKGFEPKLQTPQLNPSLQRT